MRWYRTRLLSVCAGTGMLLGACATYHPQPLNLSVALAPSLGQLQLQINAGGHPELPRLWRDRTVNVKDGLDEMEGKFGDSISFSRHLLQIHEI